MKEYEKLSKTCKIAWCEGFELKDERYTQVTGYIFNENNELLIVKIGDKWTVPGGHPEEGESFTETLEREVMEEACVTIRDMHYIGAVEVVENDSDIYYQLRYTARVKDVLEFEQKWETSDRKFVKLDDLDKYIPWANGVVFSGQVNCSRKFWGI